MTSNSDKLGADEAQGSRVWVITGTSTGLGRSLVQLALARGDCVTATARNVESIRDFTDDPNTASQVHIMSLDVTASFSELRKMAGEFVRKWGRVDVLVNNAGSCLLGMTEEVGVEGYREQYETNFFGQLNVTNAFLPYMRERRAGTIVFIGSRSAWRANMPMTGMYASSKAALSAAAEALAVEVAPLGIKVLNVIPGGLQTRFWNEFVFQPTASDALLPPLVKQASVERPESGTISSTGEQHPDNSDESKERRIADYIELQKRQIAWARVVSAHINGDTDKCARAIFDVVTGKVSTTSTGSDEKEGRNRDWPDLNMLVLGADAEANIRDKCHAIMRNLDEWRDVIRGIALDN